MKKLTGSTGHAATRVAGRGRCMQDPWVDVQTEQPSRR